MRSSDIDRKRRHASFHGEIHGGGAFSNFQVTLSQKPGFKYICVYNYIYTGIYTSINTRGKVCLSLNLGQNVDGQ